MAKPLFDLERIDSDGLRRVAMVLRRIGYTEQGVRERLGLDDITQVRLSAYPHYHHRSLRRRDPLDVAIGLFLLQGRVPEEELGEVLDLPARRLLRAAGILAGERSSRSYRARVSLYPVGEERLFATDHRFQHTPWLRARLPRDPVMYLGDDTYFLARCTPRRPARAVLDLCTGSGVHAILASSGAERAIGVDLNPRAVNFARLNAMLNDTWNAVFLEGDLFGPVGGERFDLIVANPPFVPAPVYELMYRDGGPSGADVVRRIVAALPDYLSTGGVAQIVTHLAERDGERYLDRVRRWLGGANMHLHSLRIGEDDVVDYAVAQTKRAFGEDYERYSSRLVEWITNLRAQRFKRVVGVVLTFAWNEEAPLPPWTQEDEVKPPPRDVGGELERLLAAKRRARTLTPAALDRMRVMLPDDLVLTERLRPSGRGLETDVYRVSFRDGALTPELEVKPLVRDLLRQVDNRCTVPEAIARLAQARGVSADSLDERGRKAFLLMFERGLVTFDELPAAPAELTATPTEPARGPLGADEEARG